MAISHLAYQCDTAAEYTTNNQRNTKSGYLEKTVPNCGKSHFDISAQKQKLLSFISSCSLTKALYSNLIC